MKLIIIITALFLMAWAALWWVAKDELRAHIGPGFAANFLIPVAAATMVPSGPLFFALLFVVTVATTTRRADALCRFVLMAALLPNPIYYVAAGSYVLFELTTHVVLAFAVLIVLLIRHDDGARAPRGFSPEDALVIVIALIWWLGADHSPTLVAFVRGGLNPGLIALTYVVLRSGLRDADEFKRVLGCVAVSGVILSCYAAYETLNRWELLRVAGEHISGYPLSRGVYLRGGLLRPSASMGSPLMLTCYLSLCVLAAMVSQHLFRNRLFHWACVAVILLGVVLGQSRGNIAVLAIGILALLVFQRKWAHAAGFIGLGALAAVAFTAVSAAHQGADKLFDAGEGYVYNGKLYSDYREVLFYRGLEEGMKHPLFGSGVEEVRGSLVDLTQGEGIIDFVNTYLFAFMTTGFAGLAPFVLLICLELVRVFKKKVGLDASGLQIRAFLLAGMISVYVELSFMSYVDRIPFMLFLLAAGARLFVLGRNRTADEADAGAGAKPAPRKLVESDADFSGRAGSSVSDAPAFAG